MVGFGIYNISESKLNSCNIHYSGKSTLADGLLEHTGTIKRLDSNAQVLDKLRVERERGA